MNSEKPLGRYDSVDRAVDQNGEEVFIGNVDETGRQAIVTPEQIFKATGHHPDERTYFDMGVEAERIEAEKRAAQALEQGDSAAVVGEVVAPPAVIEASSEPTAEPLLEAAPSEPTRIEVKIEDELAGTPETDPEDRPASAETETGKENYRREAINPENILELKDKFDQAYSKELELHNIKTDEDKNKDPWMVESSAEHVRNKLLREYLKIGEKDWDQQELAEVRNDIIHMMSLSTKTLESLMLKSEENSDDVAAAPTVIAPEPLVAEPTPTPQATPETDEETPDETLETEELSGRKKAWQRLKDFASGRTLLAMFNRKAAEQPEEQDPDKRRRSKWGLIVGGLALLGAGYLAGKYGVPGFGGDDGGSKDAIGDAIPGTGGGADTAGGGHIEVFNNVEGDRSVQSILPDSLIQERTPGGYEHIIDKNTGQEVIDHVTYAENGRYSIDTISELKDHGYDVGTRNIEIFDSTGPGPRGDITHKVSEVTS